MNIIDLATKTMQSTINTAVAGVKSAVDAIKSVVDTTKTKVDALDTRTSSMSSTLNTINTNIGSAINGRAVKNAQRGRFTSYDIPYGQSHNVMLGSITASKSIYFVQQDLGPNIDISLTNSTLSFTNLNYNSTIRLTGINWQIIEFY